MWKKANFARYFTSMNQHFYKDHDFKTYSQVLADYPDPNNNSLLNLQNISFIIDSIITYITIYN